MKKVLFVCLGNICRSPAAEAVFAQKAEQAGLLVLTDSAGTGNWHVGEPPYGPMIAAAQERGYDLSALRGRQFTREDFGAFDLIVTMDEANLQDVERLRPDYEKTPVKPMLSYVSGSTVTEVPDPYYTREFDVTLGLIEQAADAMVAALRA